jgi:hypothetical protein
MKISKRILAMVLVVLSISSILTITAFAADPGGRKTGVAFVDASSLRLRAEPSTKSATLDYAYRNEVVVTLGKTGQWYHVLYNLQEGYMHEDYLEFVTIENVELGYGKVNGTYVNMRKGPATSYKSIGKSMPGDLCYIIGINKQWYKVIWEDEICYIRSDFLDLTEIPYETGTPTKCLCSLSTVSGSVPRSRWKISRTATITSALFPLRPRPRRPAALQRLSSPQPRPAWASATNGVAKA